MRFGVLGIEVIRSWEFVLIVGVGGVLCVRVKRRGLGFLGSWGIFWVLGKGFRVVLE